MSYDGFRDAAIGSLYQQLQLDMISNNLANSDTSGYKADRMVFEEILGHEMKVDHRQGSLKPTGNPLDLAIEGDGFFQVETDNGVRLSRDGSFKMLQNGSLVTDQGYRVLAQGGGPIQLDPEGDQPYIDSQGNISQGGEQIASIAVVEVDDLNSLNKEGHNLYAAAKGELATAPADEFSLNQGYLEASNVTVVEQMVNMITAHRAFETYQKTIHSLQEVDTKTINQVGRIG